MMRRLTLFCLMHFYVVFLQAPYEEITHCSSSYEYDVAGNPIGLKIQMRQIVVPVVDGMRMEWQKEERVVEQIFSIHNQTKIEETENSPSVQIIKSEAEPYRLQQARSSSLLFHKQQEIGFFSSVKMMPHQATAFESMSNHDVMMAVLYDRYCRAWYHMSSSQKYNMMGLGYEKFEQKLLSDQSLQDCAVWELWREYKDKRLWNVGDQKQIREQSICRELGQRQKNRQQEIEELFSKKVQQEKYKAEQKLLQAHQEKRLIKGKAVQASYESLKQFSQEHGIVCDEFLQTGDCALEASRLHCYEQYEMHYELDDQTRGYLLYKNIDYAELELFVGTDLQQEFHAQTCKIFKDAAQLQSKMFYESELLTGASLFSVAAYETNKQELTAATGALCWAGAQLTKYVAITIDIAQRYGLAVMQGVVESGVDFVHMVTSPCETLCGIGTMLYLILEIAAFEQAAMDFSHDAKVVALAQQRRDQISNGLHQLVVHCKNMDGPARVKALTKFGADFVVPGKIIGACAYLLGGACSRAKGLRNIKNAMSMLVEDLGAEQALEYAVESVGKIANEEGAFTEITAEFLEVENQLSKVNRAARPLKAIVDEIRNVYNGVIPFDRPDLYEEINLALREIMEKINKPVAQALISKYKSKFVEGKNVQMNWSHVTSCGFNLKKYGSKQAFEILLEVSHESGVCALLQDAGIVKITKVEKLYSGCCKYTLENSFNGKVFEKTEFPVGWSAEKILQSGWNIYEDYSVVTDLARDGKLSKVGLVDNVAVKVVATNHPTDCNIITIYPC